MYNIFTPTVSHVVFLWHVPLSLLDNGVEYCSLPDCLPTPCQNNNATSLFCRQAGRHHQVTAQYIVQCPSQWTSSLSSLTDFCWPRWPWTLWVLWWYLRLADLPVSRCSSASPSLCLRTLLSRSNSFRVLPLTGDCTCSLWGLLLRGCYYSIRRGHLKIQRHQSQLGYCMRQYYNQLILQWRNAYRRHH